MGSRGVGEKHSLPIPPFSWSSDDEDDEEEGCCGCQGDVGSCHDSGSNYYFARCFIHASLSPSVMPQAGNHYPEAPGEPGILRACERRNQDINLHQSDSKTWLVSLHIKQRKLHIKD